MDKPIQAGFILHPLGLVLCIKTTLEFAGLICADLHSDQLVRSSGCSDCDGSHVGWCLGTGNNNSEIVLREWMRRTRDRKYRVNRPGLAQVMSRTSSGCVDAGEYIVCCRTCYTGII